MKIIHEVNLSRDSANTTPQPLLVEQTEHRIDLILSNPNREISILKIDLEKLLHNITNVQF